MRYKYLIFTILTSLFCSCSPLLPPTATHNATLDKYKYVFITNTDEITSVSGGSYGFIGSVSSTSINPADLICGHFIKRGFTRLPELKPEFAEQTIIVNYGESGRRNTGWGSYTIEVTIQLLSAKTTEVICVGTAEGRGRTEADDVRIAINRCMDKIFE